MTHVRIRRRSLSRDEAAPTDVAPGSSLVFPRLPVRVSHGGDSFVADSTIAVLYVRPEPFARERLDPRGVGERLDRDSGGRRRGGGRTARRSPDDAVRVLMRNAGAAAGAIDARRDRGERRVIPSGSRRRSLLLDSLIVRPVRRVAGAPRRLATPPKPSSPAIRPPPCRCRSSPPPWARPFSSVPVSTAWGGHFAQRVCDQLRVSARRSTSWRATSWRRPPLRSVSDRRDPWVFRRRFRQLTGLTIDCARRRTTQRQGPSASARRGLHGTRIGVARLVPIGESRRTDGPR